MRRQRRRVRPKCFEHCHGTLDLYCWDGGKTWIVDGEPAGEAKRAAAATAAAAETLLDAMRPGGRIAIMGPNFRYCAKDYFNCADHTVAMTHVGVAEHVYAAGFDVTTVTPRFLPYSFRGLLPPSPPLTRLYLRLPPLWRLLGKQFLVLGRKPARNPAR